MSEESIEFILKDFAGDLYRFYYLPLPSAVVSTVDIIRRDQGVLEMRERFLLIIVATRAASASCAWTTERNASRVFRHCIEWLTAAETCS